MKKILSTLIAFAVIITLCSSFIIEVAAASGSFDGASNVYKGDSFEVAFKITSTKCFGINATLNFDSTVLRLDEITDKTGKTVEYGANKTVFADIDSSPIEGSGKILKFKFTAIGSVGKEAKINLTGISITEGDNYDEVTLSGASHSVKIEEKTTSSTPSSSSQNSSSSSPASSQPTPSSSKPSTSSSRPSSSVSSVPKNGSVENTSSVQSSSSSKDTSSVTTEVKESSETTGVKDPAEKENTEKGNMKPILIIITVIVLGAALFALVYIKKQKN